LQKSADLFSPVFHDEAIKNADLARSGRRVAGDLIAIYGGAGRASDNMKYSIACLLLAVSIANPVFADTVKIPEDVGAVTRLRARLRRGRRVTS
jgi:hypothetical protein